MPSDARSPRPSESFSTPRPSGSNGTEPRPARAHANKQCLSFPVDMLKEIELEAVRLDRSVSWVVQRAWKLARAELKKTDPI
jgi:uncharacterized small protein (TIGR04563 family)